MPEGGFIRDCDCLSEHRRATLVSTADNTMNVPLLELNTQNQALEPELKEAFERVLRSGRFILGPELESFENAVAELSGVRHGVGVTSGTDAILLALMALGIGPGDEVLCPSFTFFATAGCIARAGAVPVFVDSEPETFNIDVEDAERRITERTKAIIPVHLFGQAADMDAIAELAKRHKLAVIEDAAQALGAGHRGRPVGGIGTCGTFSFFPSKNLGGFGDAGMLVTDDETLAHKARILRMHGAEPKYYHKYIGGNFRMDPLQAALLQVKLPHCETYNKNRRANAAAYAEALDALPGVGVAGESDGEPPRLLRPSERPDRYHIWNQYTLRVTGEGRRDALKRFLNERDIGAEIYYPVPLHRQECFQPFEPADFLPVCETLAAEVISIPVYPELGEARRNTVIEAVTAFLSEE